MRTFRSPDGFAFSGPDLQVFFNDSSKAPTFDGDASLTAARIRVESVEQTMQPLAPLATAVLNVSLAGQIIDGVEYRKKVSIADAQNLIHPDARLIIFAQVPTELGGGQATQEIVFEGYPTVQEIAFSDDDISLRITCTSVLQQLSKEKRTQIWGRHFKQSTTFVTFVEGMPTVFNYKGKPNRYKDMQIIAGTVVAKCPVFTYEGDPEATYWTYADILTYLLTFYVKQPFGEEYVLNVQQGLDMSFDKVGLATPEALVEVSQPTWKDVIGTKAEEMVLSGRNVVEALTMWCQFCGATMQQFTQIDGTDYASYLLFALNGDGGPWKDFGDDTTDRQFRKSQDDPTNTEFSLGMEGTGKEVYMQGRTIADVVFKNQVKDGHLVSDVANSDATATVMGLTPEMYEVSLGKASSGVNLFKPGWKPDELFGDNNHFSLANIAAVGATKDGSDLVGNSLTMFGRYVRGPDDSANWPYASVGRLWILNEAGEYAAGTYARVAPQAVWNVACYGDPYDFHVNALCPFSLDSNGQRTGRWFPRRRKMLPLLSKSPDGLGDQRQPPRIICSFDSGTSWMEYPGSCRISHDQCAVLLTDPNLARVKAPKIPNGQTTQPDVWSSIVQGTFRIAITCCVEGDSVCLALSDPGNPLSSLSRHKLIISHDDFRYESRTGANSDLKAATGWTGVNRDDTTRAKTLANRYVSISQRKSFSIHFTIPWLTRLWLPGDLIGGLTPIGMTFRATTSDKKRFPQVIKTTWVNSDKGQGTHLIFDDRRTDPRKEHLEA